MDGHTNVKLGRLILFRTVGDYCTNHTKLFHAFCWAKSGFSERVESGRIVA